jgi:spermidine synthase
MQRSPPLFSILLISAAALAYEVLLMRLFSIIQWHHMAFMVISLALLGYGMSGTFLTLYRSRLLPRFEQVFIANGALFGLSIVGAFLAVQRIPFNTLEILWDPRQWLYLFLAYLLLAVPFFFAANCIGLTFARFGNEIPRVYSYDLTGAGFGALTVIGLLFVLKPVNLLQLLALLGVFAAIYAAWRWRVFSWRGYLPLLLTLGVILFLPQPWLQLNISPFKGLQQALQVSGTSVRAERSGPLGFLTVIESRDIPLRQAPGLSLNSSHEPPPQLGVFTDGDGLSAITRFNGDLQSLAYLGDLTSALPYRLAQPRRVLLLGMGGGSGILQAVYHGVERIDAVEMDQNQLQLLTQEFAQFSGWPLLQQKVNVHPEEARSFVAASEERFDLIQLSLMDSAGAASAGVYALSANYLYTTEAFREYLQHLQPGGLLAVTRWLQLPPRDSLKLLTTAVDALGASGVEQPARQVILIRSWSSTTLLLKNSGFTESELEALRGFCDQHSFDLAWYPDMQEDEANRFNLLAQPYFYQGAKEILGSGRQGYIDDYKFDLRPASDDRPYFFHFFKWSTLPEIASLFRSGGLSLLELGYPLLIATLLQALIASALLILTPLYFLRRKEQGTDRGHPGRVVLYFSLIGLAFLFVEIAFIQKFILFLGHPLYAVAVLLCGFLIFSGLGSRFAARLGRDSHPRATLGVVAALCIIALLYLWLLPILVDGLIGLPDGAKVVLSLLLLAPLAFCMGMPFPLGLAALSRQSPQLVPWAWGINGCASLISAVLATLLAIHFGFTLVILIAVLLYLAAGMIRL